MGAIPIATMARWSSGQDAALSRRKQGFDSPTSCAKAMRIAIKKKRLIVSLLTKSVLLFFDYKAKPATK